MIRLYSAYALFDDMIPFKLEVREIPVKSVAKDGTIETDLPCFYGVMDCTNYINGKSEIKTEVEYVSGDSFVYYSESYEKCVKLLVEKREKLFQEHERMLEAADRLHRKLMDSEIQKNIKAGSPGKKKYSLWSEGYSATGEHQTATYLGEFEGDSFNDACDNWAKTVSEPEYYTPGTDKSRPSYWVCGIFDNEGDARKSFG